jgi:hypothetical protein
MLVVSGFGHEVVAQSRLTIGGRSSNFGSSNLRTGFVPDPRNVNVTSGGNIDARTLGLGSGCVGFVTARPDHILRLTGTSANLRFYVTVPGASASTRTDTTLLINGADGQWHCNDDSYGGANPTVNIPNAGPGQYDIWVGSYVSGANARGTLRITELDSNHP